jgi:hypothetical protein
LQGPNIRRENPCDGSLKVIACIENPLVIKKILTHLRVKGLHLEANGLPQSSARS